MNWDNAERIFFPSPIFQTKKVLNDIECQKDVYVKGKESLSSLDCRFPLSGTRLLTTCFLLAGMFILNINRRGFLVKVYSIN